MIGARTKPPQVDNVVRVSSGGQGADQILGIFSNSSRIRNTKIQVKFRKPEPRNCERVLNSPRAQLTHNCASGFGFGFVPPNSPADLECPSQETPRVMLERAFAVVEAECKCAAVSLL